MSVLSGLEHNNLTSLNYYEGQRHGSRWDAVIEKIDTQPLKIV